MIWRYSSLGAYKIIKRDTSVDQEEGKFVRMLVILKFATIEATF